MTHPCPCCCGNEFQHLLTFGGLPPSGLFRLDSDEQQSTFTLELELCLACSLVRQKSMVHSKDYSSVERTPALRLPAHVSELVASLSLFGIRTSDFVLEVGSNDGAFLSALRASGYLNAAGVEPSIGLAKVARGKGFTILNDHFGPTCSEEIVQRFGRPRAIMCRHTVEHVPEPFTFVRTMRECLSEKGGILLIEVPDGSAVPELLNVYELWDEHLYYFSAENIGHMLCRAGLSVTKSQVYPHLDTRNIVLWAQPGVDNVVINPYQRQMFDRRREQWRKMPRSWFQMITVLREKLDRAPRPVYVVGAGHSQTNFFNFADLGRMVDFMIDDDPQKLGKFPPMKDGEPFTISTPQFESRATRGTLILSGFGYPAWTQHIRVHAEKVGMEIIDPSIVKGAMQ